MATIDFKVFEHHKKANGTINVKLCVYHAAKRAYFSTTHYVVVSQLKKDFTVKDKDLIVKLTRELADYREAVSALGSSVKQMTAKEVGDYLLKEDVDDTAIDLISFGRAWVKELKTAGRNSYAGTIQSVINNLVDYKGTEVIYTKDITSDMLKAFEGYLRKPHSQTRLNQYNNPVTVLRPGISDAGLFAQMKDFRILFNAAREKYNDEDTGLIRIPNYPFKKYKLKTPAEPEKRSLPIEQVKLIRDCPDLKPGGRAELGRDMFMLSFYLCGINAVDIRNLNTIDNGRVSYNRSKTMNKRADNAFISIKVIPEAAPLLDKYLGKLQARYATAQNFNKAISEGLKEVAAKVNLSEFDFYAARHTVGNEAYNTLGFTMAQVGEALNHGTKTITDKYVRKTWALVDQIQEAVCGLIR
jgi:integrase